MTPTSVLTTHALIAIGYAIPLLFAPDDFLWLYGAQTDPDASHLARLFGASLVAVSAITWLAREAPEGEALDAICFGLAVGGGLSVAHALLWLGRSARRAVPPTLPSAG